MTDGYWDKLEAAHKAAGSPDHEDAPLTDAEWDERFARHYLYRWGTDRERSQSAQEEMERRHGNRPGGPVSAAGFFLRILWLTGVKRMDWKKLGFGALAAILGAVAGAIPAAAEGGISIAETWGIGAVAIGALALFLKDPNSHKGGDPRQYPGLKNTFRS